MYNNSKYILKDKNEMYNKIIYNNSNKNQKFESRTQKVYTFRAFTRLHSDIYKWHYNK